MDTAGRPSITLNLSRDIIHTFLRFNKNDSFTLLLSHNFPQQDAQLGLLFVLLAHIYDLQYVVVGGKLQRPDINLGVVFQIVLH